jgi:hypothetical protein
MQYGPVQHGRAHQTRSAGVNVGIVGYQKTIANNANNPTARGPLLLA